MRANARGGEAHHRPKGTSTRARACLGERAYVNLVEVGDAGEEQFAGLDGDVLANQVEQLRVLARVEIVKYACCRVAVKEPAKLHA